MQCRQCRKSPFERRSQISQWVYEKLLNLANDVSVVAACPIPFEAPPRARVIVVVISDYEQTEDKGQEASFSAIAPAHSMLILSQCLRLRQCRVNCITTETDIET